MRVTPPKLTDLEKRLMDALQLYVREHEPETIILRAQMAVADRKKKREKKK